MDKPEGKQKKEGGSQAKATSGASVEGHAEGVLPEFGQFPGRFRHF